MHKREFEQMMQRIKKHPAVQLTDGEMAIKKLIDESESRGFCHGVAWAAAFHGEFGGCNTEELISEAGYTWEDLKEKGVDIYDLRRLAVSIGQAGVKSLRR